MSSLDSSHLKEIFPDQTQRLRGLLEHSGEGSVSMLFATEPTGRDTQGNHTKFKNAFKAVQTQLENAPSANQATRELLQTLAPIFENHDFWQHQFQGLAIFLHTNQCWFIRTPFPLPEVSMVSEMFYLKPLFPLLQRLVQFWILAISPEKVLLFLGTPFFLEEQNLPPEVPTNIEALGLHIEDDKQLQWSGGAAGRVVHGHEDQDVRQEIPLRYVRDIDAGLQKILHNPGTPKLPLVLIAEPALADLYEKSNTYDAWYRTIHFYPGKSKTLDLLALAEPVIQELSQKQLATAKEIWKTAAAQGQAGVNDPSEAVLDAYKGKFSALWINTTVEQWGKFDPTTAQVSLFPERAAGDSELANLAGIFTLRNRGEVYCVEPQDMPEPQLPMASVWRYH